MLTLRVDFNALPSGLVRGRQPTDSAMVEGSLVLLTDGEGNEALGTLRELRDGLVFAAVDWNTWSRAGTYRQAYLRVLGQAKQTVAQATGNVRPSSIGSSTIGRLSFAEQRVPVGV